MTLVAAVFSNGWASGVNSYLVVLVLGLVGRLTGSDQVPPALMRLDVLLVAGVLYAWEFVADKIPLVDSTWDAISTAIRPTVGAIVGALLSGDATSLHQAVYAVLGGGTALASHLVKAGGRLAINTSPEPVTNSVASVLEDLAVIGVVLLAVYHPWVAAVTAAVLLACGIVLVVTIGRRVRRGWRRWKGRTPRTTPST
jgi:hypothetical protein